jgi:thioredoxin reductase
MKSRNISYSTHVEVSGLKREGSLLEVTIDHISDGKESTAYADYFIVAVGREPRTDLFSTKTEKNLDILRKNRRLYLIGDVINGIYRQTAISVGDGIRAAMEINGVLRRDI